MSQPARNLELKVKCDPEAFAAIGRRVESLVCTPIQRLRQVDTYVRVERGRLKLREIRGDEPEAIERAELIAYARPSDPGSRWSAYRVVPVATAAAPGLLAALLMTHDQLAQIDKVRLVAIIGQTRIHLDRVEGLGTFVELETVVSTQRDTDAVAEHRQIINALGLDRFPAIAGSYSDLALVRT